MRRFLHLMVTLLLLVSGPLSMPGIRVERAAQAMAENAQSHAIAAKTERSIDHRASDQHRATTAQRSRLTSADVGNETTRSLSGKVRAAMRPGSGWLGRLSQALGDTSCDDNDEIDAADPPDDVEGDGYQPGFTVVTFAEVYLFGPAATLVEPNLWGIQPAIGHPLGVDEPPRA